MTVMLQGRNTRMMGRSERLEFEGHDGGRLAARLELPIGKPRAYAIFAHCFTCSKDVFAATRISQALAARGLAVLRFDFTGLGRSDGDFGNTNFSSNIADLVAAAAYLRKTHSAPELLVGHSLGGAAVLAAAGALKEVRAVATIGAPSDAAHVVENFAADIARIEAEGQAEVSLAGRKFTIRKQFLDDVKDSALLDKVANLNKPVLVMHAPLDETVGISNASELFIAAKHPKSFVSLDDADHLLTRPADAVYVAEVLVAWSERYLSPMDANHPNLVRVSETGASKFQHLAEAGPHAVLVDEPREVGGTETGPTPYDYLSIALGACTSMTLRLYAAHKKLKLGRITVTVDHAKLHAK
ncbi:MAG: alpha/beta fold hydrolase, partial [Henriciella sp.]|uniref:bifunctional alpha/beta hydrolase/OsmC family protein n=1 Tax=Henriciella sp. TaxID=1968823 RepID=UPI003C7106F5